MRKVDKRAPPSAGIAGGNWQQASLRLRHDLDAMTPEQARVRARQSFDDEVRKVEVRAALASEQDSLCAFCEGRISPAAPLDSRGQLPRDGIRVAHWAPVEVAPERALTWTNLFASCADRDTCDQAQQNQDPAMPTVAERDWSRDLEFNASGSVAAREGAPPELVRVIGQRRDSEDGEQWEAGLWNLNHRALREARQTAISTELQQAHASRDRRAVSKKVVIDERLAQLARDPQPYQSALLQALRRWR